MSLLGALQIANNSLFAAQTGLQVTGNNIANANTPGYVRQRAVFTPAATQLIGELPLGLGVRVDGIVQEADRFLFERMRAALSDLRNSETQEETYLELESLLGELSDTDLSSSISNFFAALNDVLSQPEDLAVRNLAVLQADSLTQDVKRIDARVRELHQNLNSQVESSAEDVNRLLEEIAELNVKIIRTEGGTTSSSQAVGLRDQRDLALEKLSELIGIRVVEQHTGSVTVFAGGDFLVFEGQRRQVGVSHAIEGGLSKATLHVTETDAPLVTSTGKLTGLYTARDDILGGFLDQLDVFAGAFAFEFNKVHASGQGLSGFSEITSSAEVTDVDLALDQAGLAFDPVNGSFKIVLKNTQSGDTTTTDLLVKLNGLGDDTSLGSLTEALNDIEGLSAQITANRGLELTVDSPELEFSFADDTSGVLAALGVNAFFTGSSARDLGVSAVLRQDPGKLAASSGGVGIDTENAVALAGFVNEPLDAHGNFSIAELYENVVGGVTQASAVSRSVTDGFRVFQRTLEGQHLGISGVSIDEEAVKMIAFQRSYQATARYISTISDLLDVLVNI